MSKKLTTLEFVTNLKSSKKLVDSNNELYNFDKIDYHGTHIKVIVGCNIHGNFESRPNDLQKGKGCPKCGKIRMAYTQSIKAKNTFISKANIIHNNKYDYSEVVYINNRVKVKIICPNHGAIYVSPTNHLGGYNCPKCSIENNSGDKHSNWISDRSKIVPRIRIQGIEKWTRAVKNDQDYCDCCEVQFDMYEPKLVKIAHHLNAYKTFPEQRLNPENGVCLCQACHRSFHHVYGSGKNTAEQYYEYKELRK